MKKGKKQARSPSPGYEQDLVDQASADIEEMLFLPLIAARTLTPSKSKRPRQSEARGQQSTELNMFSGAADTVDLMHNNTVVSTQQ